MTLKFLNKFDNYTDAIGWELDDNSLFPIGTQAIIDDKSYKIEGLNFFNFIRSIARQPLASQGLTINTIEWEDPADPNSKIYTIETNNIAYISDKESWDLLQVGTQIKFNTVHPEDSIRTVVKKMYTDTYQVELDSAVCWAPKNFYQVKYVPFIIINNDVIEAYIDNLGQVTFGNEVNKDTLAHIINGSMLITKDLIVLGDINASSGAQVIFNNLKITGELDVFKIINSQTSVIDVENDIFFKTNVTLGDSIDKIITINGKIPLISNTTLESEHITVKTINCLDLLETKGNVTLGIDDTNTIILNNKLSHATIVGSLVTSGDVSLGENTLNNIDFLGKTKFKTTALFEDSVSFEENTTVEKLATFNEGVEITGNSIFNQSLDTSLFRGTLDVNILESSVAKIINDLEVEGNIICDGAINTNIIVDNSTPIDKSYINYLLSDNIFSTYISSDNISSDNISSDSIASNNLSSDNLVLNYDANIGQNIIVGEDVEIAGNLILPNNTRIDAPSATEYVDDSILTTKTCAILKNTSTVVFGAKFHESIIFHELDYESESGLVINNMKFTPPLKTVYHSGHDHKFLYNAQISMMLMPIPIPPSFSVLFQVFLVRYGLAGEELERIVLHRRYWMSPEVESLSQSDTYNINVSTLIRLSYGESVGFEYTAHNDSFDVYEARATFTLM